MSRRCRMRVGRASRSAVLSGAFVLAILSAAGAARAEAPAAEAPVAEPAKPPAAAAFEKLKTLAGEWRGKSGQGAATSLAYQVTSGGTAVLETFAFVKSGMSMTTVYYLDGDRLMLTHYCVSNNQPRMRAEPTAAEPDVLRFDFVDAT